MGRRILLETTTELRTRKIALLVLLTTMVLIGVGLSIFLYHGGSLSDIIPSFSDIQEVTPTQLFIGGALSGLFFLPIPMELPFFLAIKNGTALWLAMTFLIIGSIIGNIASYIIGYKLSRLVSALVDAKKMYQLRRKVNKYGAWAILVANSIPAPAPLLSFALGIAKYPLLRLILFMFIGNIIKYLAVYVIAFVA